MQQSSNSNSSEEDNKSESGNTNNDQLQKLISQDSQRLLAIHTMVWKLMGLSSQVSEELNRFVDKTNHQLQWNKLFEAAFVAPSVVFLLLYFFLFDDAFGSPLLQSIQPSKHPFEFFLTFHAI